MTYICPECHCEGFPSMYYSSCTACANIRRGLEQPNVGIIEQDHKKEGQIPDGTKL